jgi:hypothetical protein
MLSNRYKSTELVKLVASTYLLPNVWQRKGRSITDRGLSEFDTLLSRKVY